MSGAIAWTSVGISTVAVGLSLYSLLFTRVRDRKDVFLKMHERLLDPDLFQGRQLLFENISAVDDVIVLKRENGEGYRAINRSLAMLDVFALYAERGYVDKNLVLSEWGWVYVMVWRHGQHFARIRSSDLSLPTAPWPHLQTLASEAGYAT